MQIRKFPFFGLRVQWNDDGTKKKNCARTEYFYGHLYLARIFIVWKSGVAGSRNKMKWNVFVHFFFCSPLFVSICGGKSKKKICIQNEKKTGTQTYRPSLCMFATHLGVLTTCGATTWRKQCIDSCERVGKKMLADPWKSAETRMCGDFCARALYELKVIPESIVNVLFTVLKPLQYCRSREGTEMDASTR